MQATSKKVGPNIFEITIKESGAEMEKYKKEAVQAISSERQFAGFRKGDEVPFDVVAREVGDERLMQEALNQALRVLYPKALKKLEITPVDMGEIKDMTSFSPLDVVLTVEVAPEVELDIKKIEKIKIEVAPVAVPDEELQKELDEIIARSTHYHPRGAHHGHTHDENGEVSETDLAIQMGDKVMVNAVGYDKKGGTTDDRMKLNDFEITIGAKMMIPGFEEALVGAKEGDVVEFEVNFPKDYHSEDFAGKSAFFVTTILSVQYPHTPEWNEELIERVWGKKLSFSDFKTEYREAMLTDRAEKARTEAEEKLTQELIAINPVAVGPKMVEREVENLWIHHNREIEKQGMDVKTYLEHLKTSEDVFKKEHIEPVALKRVQAMLIMEALKKHYAPEIADDVVVAEIRKVFARYAHNADFETRVLELAKPGTEHFNDVKNRLEYRAVIDRFLK
ncbi:MAG: trigger factor [Candidatus Gracilibacteria bacterium]|jgi:trigger factor